MGLVSYLSSNIMYNFGWYVDNGALRPMRYDKPLFNKCQEKGRGISMDIGDDATYHVRGIASISFHIPLGDDFELGYVYFIHGFKKNLLSMSCMAQYNQDFLFSDNNAPLVNVVLLVRGIWIDG